LQLEELKSGSRVAGVVPGEPVTVLAVAWHGLDAIELTYKTTGGGLSQRVLFRTDEAGLALADAGARPFDADAAEFKLAAEAQRIRLAGRFDPMLAVATSAVEPLPHQIRAVYGELLPRTPLRFLLADDPGAGKTIMAGLYIKELLLRDDVTRCLVVAPGGLVEQWQDELFFKFGLQFTILTSQLVDATVAHSVFDTNPLLIARMDHLARNAELVAQLSESEWDLVVIDEAHRMAAHYFGAKLEKTKRFQLGELLGERARHLLLMTATPHSGKEEDFQLFMSLLDRDQFAGKFRRGIHTGDVSGLMRRMVKEELLTFEGRPLFPERIAQTVPYRLTDQEKDLYELVTDYVRDGMNRADAVGGKRRNTVGFALTVLQRRLASSPEAIYQSLVRRSKRLQRRRDDILAGRVSEQDALATDVEVVIDDPDEYSAEEIEQVEEDLLDSATAARTVAELEAELRELEQLVAVAKQVRDSGTDKKWTELRTILEDNTLATGGDGHPRKLIIFTEHRDTLTYLTGRIGSLLGRPSAVKAIHGGVRRGDRRQITEEFAKNPEVQILLATDAAGEGLNLQAAHLMVNYDLPWNPNRIEQRFGRIHRIGQTEVCRLWNLVASNTREGAVFTRLLDKVEEQRKAYGGKVFDVLGAAFDDTPLRELLIEAIRYGDQPETRLRMFVVIDGQVANGLKELIQERALASETLSKAALDGMRRQMDEARARRLQPHYIELAFRNAFTRLGGRLARREKGRFEISNVPAAIRQASRHAPIATRYERITFDLGLVDVEDRPRADLLAPGHPLHDAAMDETVRTLSTALDRGTVLVSASLDRPHLLVGVEEEIVDATAASVSRRFGYAYVDETGEVTPAGPAPYLDCVAAPDTEQAAAARQMPWLVDAEAKAVSWMITHQLPGYVAEVTPRRATELDRARTRVKQRLSQEINRLAGEAMAAEQKEAAGERPRETSDSLSRKADDLSARLDRRLALLDRQAQMSTKPPRVVMTALVLPLAMVDQQIPQDAPIHAVETKTVERRGIECVLAAERALGRTPHEQPFTNPGFDVLSDNPAGEPIRIEVKARIDGATDFFVTHNEVLTAKNAAPRYRLALVRVDSRGPEQDEVRYLADPFQTVDLGDFAVTGIRGDWAKTWAKGQRPF
jgi:superfamily II DNA or RNA helicase